MYHFFILSMGVLVALSSYVITTLSLPYYLLVSGTAPVVYAPPSFSLLQLFSPITYPQCSPTFRSSLEKHTPT